MPHSGGGGSHSGGSHSGSSHRSSGSYSRGSSGSGISNSYFRGANRYVYYRNHKPHYYYAKRRYRPHAGSGVELLFGLIWLCLSLAFVMRVVDVSKGALRLDYADTQIVIDDEVGLVEDADALKKTMQEFQEQTGVTMAVVTRRPENADMGVNCETQAYNCYVSRWDDESHWLIYYVGSDPKRSDDWEWDLMCGDNCVSVLSTEQEDAFSESFHRYLVAAQRYSFDAAVATALAELTPSTGLHFTTMTGRPLTLEMVCMLLIFPLIGLWLTLSSLKSLFKKPSEEEMAKSRAVKIPVKQEPVEDVCEYCKGVYVIGSVDQCPHCGAPLRVHNQ